VPLVWKGLSFALWGGFVAAGLAFAFLVAAALPATACFTLFSAVFRVAGISAFSANVLAFVALTALALAVLNQAPLDVTRDLPLRVWITPLVLAIPVALRTFSDAKQGAAGGLS
jgi:hypothetical protein